MSIETLGPQTPLEHSEDTRLHGQNIAESLGGGLRRDGEQKSSLGDENRQLSKREQSFIDDIERLKQTGNSSLTEIVGVVEESVMRNGIKICFTDSAEIAKELADKIAGGKIRGEIRMIYGTPIPGMIAHVQTVVKTSEGTFVVDTVGQKSMGFTPGIHRVDDEVGSKFWDKPGNIYEITDPIVKGDTHLIDGRPNGSEKSTKDISQELFLPLTPLSKPPGSSVTPSPQPPTPEQGSSLTGWAQQTRERLQRERAANPPIQAPPEQPKPAWMNQPRPAQEQASTPVAPATIETRPAGPKVIGRTEEPVGGRTAATRVTEQLADGTSRQFIEVKAPEIKGSVRDFGTNGDLERTLNAAAQAMDQVKPGTQVKIVFPDGKAIGVTRITTRVSPTGSRWSGEGKSPIQEVTIDGVKVGIERKVGKGEAGSTNDEVTFSPLDKNGNRVKIGGTRLGNEQTSRSTGSSIFTTIQVDGQPTVVIIRPESSDMLHVPGENDLRNRADNPDAFGEQILRIGAQYQGAYRIEAGVDRLMHLDRIGQETNRRLAEIQATPRTDASPGDSERTIEGTGRSEKRKNSEQQGSRRVEGPQELGKRRPDGTVETPERAPITAGDVIRGIGTAILTGIHGNKPFLDNNGNPINDTPTPTEQAEAPEPEGPATVTIVDGPPQQYDPFDDPEYRKEYEKWMEDQARKVAEKAERAREQQEYREAQQREKQRREDENAERERRHQEQKDERKRQDAESRRPAQPSTEARENDTREREGENPQEQPGSEERTDAPRGSLLGALRGMFGGRKNNPSTQPEQDDGGQDRDFDPGPETTRTPQQPATPQTTDESPTNGSSGYVPEDSWDNPTPPPPPKPEENKSKPSQRNDERKEPEQQTPSVPNEKTNQYPPPSNDRRSTQEKLDNASYNKIPGISGADIARIQNQIAKTGTVREEDLGRLAQILDAEKEFREQQGKKMQAPLEPEDHQGEFTPRPANSSARLPISNRVPAMDRNGPSLQSQMRPPETPGNGSESDSFDPDNPFAGLIDD